MKQKVIVDCDPGYDDAFAVMLAASHLDVLGLTTIGGNSGLDKVTINALKVLEVIRRPDIPVFRGHAGPMVVPLLKGPEFIGKSGLDGPVLPPPSISEQKQHAVDFIIDTVRGTGDVTLIGIGPLTNIASAINRDPGIVSRIREIAVMGGSVTCGNWTAAAEFNIYADPEAAYRVFRSGIPIRMCGINLTRQSAFGAEELNALRRIPTKAAGFAADLLQFILNPPGDAPPQKAAFLHDACTAAWVIDPDIVTGAAMHIDIELKGEFTRGMTVCDYRHLRGTVPSVDIHREPLGPPRGEAPNAVAGLELDVEAFKKLILDTLGSLP